MKKRLTIAIAVAALAATVTSLTAASLYQRQRAQVTAADALPAYEIVNNVRALGFRPTTQALRRGPYYVMHAYDPHGVEVRVVADAQLGDVVSVTPVSTPRYNGGPHIIHVPQPGERDEHSSSASEDGEAAVSDENDDQDVERPAPASRPAVHRSFEAPPTRASADPVPPARPEPKSLGLPRAVLSAPPPVGDLTPVYPTPKFKSDPSEKFSEPDERSDNIPPTGYTPPAPPRDND